jgi:hypothetical protein
MACGKKPGSYEIKSASEDAQVDQLKAQAEALWLERGNQAKLQEAMDVYEQLFAQNPADKEVAARLIRGWYFYGDAYETEIEAKRSVWDKAITFGDKCLALNPEFSAKLAAGESKEAAAAVLTKEDVPCAYWTASALGKWAKSGGLAVTLKHIGTAKAYIAQVESLEPTYFYGAAHRYWGAYYAGLPSFAGQDLNRSQEEFKKSMDIAPDYLGTRILYADYWATKNQDQIAIFDEMVQYVMQVDLDALDPELRPENEAEKRKAEALWAARADKFLDAPEPAPLAVELPKPDMQAQEAQMEDPSIQAPPAEETEEAPATEGEATEATEAPAAE